MKRFVILKNDSGQRLDKFLQKAAPAMPASFMHKQIRKKNIKLNGKRCVSNTKLLENDILELYINDEFFENAKNTKNINFLNSPSEIDIVYEDENIILVNKKSGLLSHDGDNSNSSSSNNNSDTLINRIKHYLYINNQYDHDAENSFTPALCNRIDRNTSGIVIAAKNAETLRIINQKIKDREILKYYLCVTVGLPPKEHDTITVYIEKNEQTNTVKVWDKKTPHNKTAVTEYKVLKQNGKLALLEVLLHTGRTHQIRATMAHIGCPLLGDGKYGSTKANREYGAKTQALCSYKIKFAFKSDAGVLDYLKGREFELENAPDWGFD